MTEMIVGLLIGSVIGFTVAYRAVIAEQRIRIAILRAANKRMAQQLAGLMEPPSTSLRRPDGRYS